MAGKSQSGARVDMGPLFEKNRPILETHNISGAKVLHLLVQAAGRADTTWGEAHAAHGLGLAFCYMPGNFGGSVYSSNMDLPQRAGPLLGCRFDSIWTAKPREGWDFIKAGLDAGNPVKLAGPEDSVICDYTNARRVADRSVWSRSVGGPGLEGHIHWEELSEWISSPTFLVMMGRDSRKGPRRPYTGIIQRFGLLPSVYTKWPGKSGPVGGCRRGVVGSY